MKKFFKYSVLVSMLFVLQPMFSTALARDGYIGDIIMVGYNFCPRNTEPASGQLIPISQNQALFSLFGTIYGGDGRTTFALPDLRGRSPVGGGLTLGQGPGLSNVQLGQKGGTETVTLTTNNLPNHSHNLPISTSEADDADPTGKTLGAGTFYTDEAANTSITTTSVGGGQSFATRSPYLGITFCVVTVGIFPSRN